MRCLLGIACKWTGVYAGCGLALLFFAHLLRRYREYLYAKAHPGKSTNGIDHKYIVKNFPDYTIKTIDFCLTFFVLIPVVIYLLSYLPFVNTAHPGLLDRMLANQTSMFNYHTGLEATHPYSSSWYEWPTMVRPIWYYSGYVTDAIKEGISAFGNPVVWWIGIPAFIYILYLLIRNNAFLCSLTRHTKTEITFIYHYFPSVPFVVLMIVYSLMQWKKHMSDRTFIIVCCTYAAVAFALFLLFYPVLSGQPVDVDFVIKYLRWRPTWVLISG